MRPIKLTMQAFGSYGQKTIIDFQRPEQNLFLITGDTGSGKTTIFDAMVFALYGEASSGLNKKSGNELLSQYNEKYLEPYVELIFSETKSGETKLYTVKRTPKHKKPGNKTEKPASVIFTLPDGSDTRGKIADINAKIIDIVGLEKDQFMQVGMIAQGEFMDVLRKSSNEKKEIFRRIFKTEEFQRIIFEFKRRRDQKYRETDTLRALCQSEVARIEVPGDYAAREELEQLKSEISSETTQNIVDFERIANLLDELCGDLKEQVQSLQNRLEELKKSSREKTKAYTTAEALKQSFEAKAEAEEKLQYYKGKQDEILHKKELAIQIEDSYEIKREHDNLKRVERTLEQTEEAIKVIEEKLPDLKRRTEEAEKYEGAQAKKYQEMQAEFTKVEEKVKEAEEQFAEIQKQKEALSKSGEKRQGSADRLEACRKIYDDFVENEGKWKEELESLKNAREELTLWQKEQDDADQIQSDLKAYEEKEKELSRCEQSIEKNQKEYDFYRGEFEKANRTYEEKNQIFLDAQAGYIAKEELKEGKPCPVCGSLHHPSPCRLSEESENITRENLQELRERRNQLDHKRQELSEEIGKAKAALKLAKEHQETELKRIRAAYNKHHPSLMDGEKVVQLKSAIKTWMKELEDQGQLYKQHASQKEKLEQKVNGAAEEKAKLFKEKEEAEQKWLESDGDYKIQKESLNVLESQKKFESLNQAKDQLAESKEKKNGEAVSWEAAKRGLTEAREEYTRKQSELTTHKENLPAQKAEFNELAKVYEEKLKEKDGSPAQWMDITANYSKAQAQSIREECSQYDKNKATAEAERDTAEKQINGAQKPDLEHLRQESEKADRLSSEAAAALSEMEALLKTDKDTLGKLNEIMTSRGQVMAEYDRINELYIRLNGGKSGKRMDIETYVQRYYLKRILSSANQRFREMSGGQYELQMVPEQDAGDGGNKGLDLMVYSNVTGKTREVRTLSGGESFMAALSLALGMADQIKAESSSVNLDVMFIDEGFGSLDDHSRFHAVKVLKEMAGGSKLIGMISHVSELKQEIDDILQVTKDQTGSKAGWL